MADRDLLEGLLALADRAGLEVRILAPGRGLGEPGPSGSAACRVGERVWVVLAPDDPARHQAGVLAQALTRYRAAFLEETFVAPGLRDFLDGNASP